MPTAPPIPAFALALLAPLAGGVRGPAPDPPASETREEPFVLRIAERTAAGASVDRPVGVGVLRRRAEPSGVQLECELEFALEDVRAMQIERSAGARREIVWREWRAGGGRTLHVTGDSATPRLELVDWGGPEAVRATLESASRVWTWLELGERARAGDLEPGHVALLDPLAREIVAVDVLVTWRADARGLAGETRLVRDVELVRDDGTSAGGFTFSGDTCLALRWQGGPLRAERVTPGEMERCATDLGCALRAVSAAEPGAGAATAVAPRARAAEPAQAVPPAQAAEKDR